MSKYVNGKYFFGNEISSYGQKNGYVDYFTLAKAFNHVMCNNIITRLNNEVGYFEPYCGLEEYYEHDGEEYSANELEDMISETEGKISEIEEEIEDNEENGELKEELEELNKQLEEMNEALNNPCYADIYQYFIIDSSGAEILANWTNEIVYYNEELDMYVWCVTHWGTSWNYVLTNIRCNVK